MEEMMDNFVRDATSVVPMAKSEARSRLSDILEEYKKVLDNLPMGVSQWRNHGEKWGYDKYFKDKEKIDEGCAWSKTCDGECRE